MVYRIGIVGAGHWSKRLNKGIKKGTPFSIDKTVDVQTYEEKKELLTALDISRDNHYTIEEAESISDEFYEDLDIVQIASPVEYHRNQTVEALEHDVFTITEKSYAANRDKFEEVLDYLSDRGKWGSSYLHLHYLKKLLTIQMPDVLSRMRERYGGIERAEATFIEQYSEEDRRRSWLFSPSNGGVFLDWIHPIEVLASSCGAMFVDLVEGKPYLVSDRYTDEYMTAAYGDFKVEGEYFEDDARARIRVGKGFEQSNRKVLRLVFSESDPHAHVDFLYADSEREFRSDYRGEWRWIEDGEVVDQKYPEGPIPYKLLIQDLELAAEGEYDTKPEELVRRMYEPVWMFNDQVDISEPVRDEEEIQEFVRDAVDSTSV
ncbi:MAG: hypothetical protein ABEK59_07770 [Halobacteria archaeon]